MNFYQAWDFLENHKIYKIMDCPWNFQDSLDIQVVRNTCKNEPTQSIEEGSNITKIIIETGPFIFDKEKNKYCMTHDIRLDSTGQNFEESIINLAYKVEKYYGQ